jgi:hypothetical protein
VDAARGHAETAEEENEMASALHRVTFLVMDGFSSCNSLKARGSRQLLWSTIPIVPRQQARLESCPTRWIFLDSMERIGYVAFSFYHIIATEVVLCEPI